MPSQTVHEILSTTCRKRRDRKTYLGSFVSYEPLRFVLQGAFDDTITFNLPEGEPPFVPAESPTNTLERSYRDIIFFCKGGSGKNVNALVREKKFMDWVSSLPKEDVSILVAMKDKKLDTLYPCITKKLVQEMFPNLLRK